jgi:hypothetical protein
MAQTPFEFGVVQDLIQGEPYVSVISIKVSGGVPSSGCTMLEMAVRAGLIFEGESSSFMPDSLLPGGVRFTGQILYNGVVPESTIERIFSVIKTNLDKFPGTRVTHVSLVLISHDDMSWVSIRCPMERADSLLAGMIDHLDFWMRTDVWELEIGTGGMPVTADAPTISAMYAPSMGTVPDVRIDNASAHAWKSLVLPGWGQLSSGRGIGWLNLLVEAGGVALILSDHDEAGAAVLGVNHIISFADLL